MQVKILRIVKTIESMYRKHNQQVRYEIALTKNIKSKEELKDWAMQTQPSSDYVQPLKRLDELQALEKKERQQGEVVKPKQDADLIAENQSYTIVDAPTQTESVFDFDVYYDGRKQIVIIVGIYFGKEKKEIVMTTINVKALQMKDFSIKKLKESIEEVVFKQLRFFPNGCLLYFEEPKVVDLDLEKEKLEEKNKKLQLLKEEMERQKDMATQIELQTVFINKEYLIKWLVQWSNESLILVLQNVNVIRINTSHAFHLNSFGCPAMVPIWKQKVQQGRPPYSLPSPAVACIGRFPPVFPGLRLFAFICRPSPVFAGLRVNRLTPNATGNFPPPVTCFYAQSPDQLAKTFTKILNQLNAQLCYGVYGEEQCLLINHK